ncbi:hypothetical protein BDN70DRAFT_920957 [Pholiota conissans]|uniref:Uncharacterized protein n=1 Tax=Pholiota conissans TaxID=109636 RepID=A0A9P5Z3A3_9AGAR|nr:hypothetical protein BDN70DRAFT_920957 [Pholiota conissans]
MYKRLETYGQRTTACYIRLVGRLPRCDGQKLLSLVDPFVIIRAHIPLNPTTAVWCSANIPLCGHECGYACADVYQFIFGMFGSSLIHRFIYCERVDNVMQELIGWHSALILALSATRTTPTFQQLQYVHHSRDDTHEERQCRSDGPNNNAMNHPTLSTGQWRAALPEPPV